MQSLIFFKLWITKLIISMVICFFRLCSAIRFLLTSNSISLNHFSIYIYYFYKHRPYISAANMWTQIFDLRATFKRKHKELYVEPSAYTHDASAKFNVSKFKCRKRSNEFLWVLNMRYEYAQSDSILKFSAVYFSSMISKRRLLTSITLWLPSTRLNCFSLFQCKKKLSNELFFPVMVLR